MSKKDLFEFNLLYGRKLKVKKKKRKNSDGSLSSVQYSFALIFGSIFFYLVLLGIQYLLIDSQRNSINAERQAINQELSQFNETISANGELIAKSRLLESIVLEDQKLDTFFSIVEEIVPNDSQVIRYEKTNLGFYIFTLSLNNPNIVPDVISEIQEDSRTNDVFVRQVEIDNLDSDLTNLTIELRIVNEQE